MCGDIARDVVFVRCGAALREFDGMLVLFNTDDFLEVRGETFRKETGAAIRIQEQALTTLYRLLHEIDEQPSNGRVCLLEKRSATARPQRVVAVVNG
jgi:hypothetical protein